MSSEVLLYALIALIIGLGCGLLPVFSKIGNDNDRLRMLTGVAAGIILASALIVVIPEGYELATTDEHAAEDKLAGDIALVFVEVDSNVINASQGIEEIELLLGGSHEHEEGHAEDEKKDGLVAEVKHVIEEVEEGEITASVGIEEILVLITSHSHEEGHEDHMNGLILGGAILAGFLLMLILEGSGVGHSVHEEHHDHGHDHGHAHVHHNTSAGWMLVLGLSLHAATDGLAIGAAAATGSISLTATVIFAVLIHKGPAAFSLGVFSMHERQDRKSSIKDVVIFSLATPIMILIAYFALEGVETSMIGLAMLFSAGTFLYVATIDTLPDIHNPETGKKALQYVILGVIILSVVLFGVDAAGLLGEHGH